MVLSQNVCVEKIINGAETQIMLTVFCDEKGPITLDFPKKKKGTIVNIVFC